MRRERLTSLVLFFATCAVFSRVLVADFVEWDDDINVYHNLRIQGLGWDHIRWMFTDASYALRYKPLTWLSYALVYHFGALNPVGYHLLNLVLHALNAVLAFVVIRRLLTAGAPEREAAERIERATIPAAFAALLWAINPLRVEPVARVTDLTFCLSLFFLLASLWCYLRAHEGNEAERGRKRLYWWSVGAFALAMLSYPSAAGYAVVLLALDWHPLRRFEGCAHWWDDVRARKVLLEKLPFLLLGGMMLISIFARFNPTGDWTGYQADNTFNPFERLMQAFYVWAYYAWKPWAPFHLSSVYTTLVNFNPNAWPFWLSAAFVVGTTGLLVWRRQQWPWALTLWVSHLVLLAPMLGLTERPHYTSDRYDYLPSLVWAVLLAAAVCKVSTLARLRTTVVTLGFALALLFGGLSFRQTRIWKNSIALFSYMIGELENDPYSADIHWRLGRVYAGQGKIQEAVQQYQTSLQIQPNHVYAYDDLGVALLREGQVDQGVAQLRKALAIRPNFAEAHQNLGGALARKGQADEAIFHFEQALAIRPNFAEANYNLGNVLLQKGQAKEAVAHFQRTLEIWPNFAEAQNNLAWVLATCPEASLRDGARAVELAQQAERLAGGKNVTILGTLAAAYAETGRFSEAVAVAQRALDLATAQTNTPQVNSLRAQLGLYLRGSPFRDTGLTAVAPEPNRP